MRFVSAAPGVVLPSPISTARFLRATSEACNQFVKSQFRPDRHTTDTPAGLPCPHPAGNRGDGMGPVV